MNPNKKMLPACIFCVLTASHLLFVGGCASTGAQMSQHEDATDPWQGMNRKVFAFNETIDSVTLKPIAQGYHKLPSFIRYRVSNFFANLDDIPNTANNLLQAKLGDAASDVMRFVVNTTFGILGLFDVASNMGFDKHDEDFGQTLAQWGVGSGPYLVAPLFGPSTARDLPGTVVDYFMSPLTYVGDIATRNILRATDAVETRSDFLAREDVIREISPDFYSAVKSFYLDRRKAQVRDGHDADDIEDLYDEVSDLSR